MKKQLHPTPKRQEQAQQTDIEDSYFHYLQKPKFHPKTKHLRQRPSIPSHLKIMRFCLKKSKKTLRVPLYDQEDLNLPVRFTRKLATIEVDNDVETDEELVANQVGRCEQWLREAAREQSNQ